MADALTLELQNSKREWDRVQRQARSVNNDNEQKETGGNLAQKGTAALGRGLQLGGRGLETAGEGMQMAGRGTQAAGSAIGGGLGAGIGGAVGGVAGAIGGSVLPGAGTFAGAAAGARTGAGIGEKGGQTLGQLPGQAMQAGGRGMTAAGKGMEKGGGILNNARRFNQILKGNDQTFNRIKELAKKSTLEIDKTFAEKFKGALQSPFAWLLRLAWLNLIWSFGLTYIYIAIHFLAAYAMPFGETLFCKFGQEWSSFVGIKGQGSAKRLGKTIEPLELSAFLFIGLVIFLIVVLTLSIFGFIAYAWANPLDTLRLTSGVSWELIKCFIEGHFGIGSAGDCSGATSNQDSVTPTQNRGSTSNRVPDSAGSATGGGSGAAGGSSAGQSGASGFKY
ncbi:MAG: hypothetical protein A3A24_03115 [Candidatus Buchananbacteria bacterium RIFCSPLOWO2_01_FULL_46_12]|uniref:Uncharacterized protein n=1 Tax=Candidatus Buchananbacteria bacterium RIFCSPLOWO2_01_FULL_46_12 TaxID=1797546 RepID=A0A1G1YNV3_9BACT|nr:MAG: hypothetical protein A3A24_03115 [Candidatus Buchananbacteria bacterium RIFCSPLOWO2_01_FULL_46_12]